MFCLLLVEFEYPEDEDGNWALGRPTWQPDITQDGNPKRAVDGNILTKYRSGLKYFISVKSSKNLES